MSEPATVIARLAREWEHPGATAFCRSLEALSWQVPAEAVIHSGRNLIFRHRVGEEEVAVKRFPVSGGRRLVYRLRSSKAVRAFDTAVRLLALGMATPTPLAAVEVRRGSALLASFYCCAFLPAFREARSLKSVETSDRVALLERLGEFVGRLHDSGVLHRDLTSGNVLLTADPTKPGGVAFQLVDLNRVRFGRVAPWVGIANLAQLRMPESEPLLSGYCRARRLLASRAAPYYRFRLGLRTLAQTIKQRTRPLRRRIGL